MIKRFLPLFALLAAIGALMALATTRVQADPGQGSQCVGCHPADMPATWISVTVASETETTISYDITGSDNYDAPEGWAVFNPGGSNVANGYGPGSFTLSKDGSTYRVYWVDNADTCDTIPAPPNCGKGGAAYENIVPASDTPTPTTTSESGTTMPTSEPDTPTSEPDTPTSVHDTPMSEPAAPAPMSVSEASTPTPSGTAAPGSKSAVYGTAHDLGSPAIPTCEQCHTPHNAQGNYLWARAPKTGMSGLQALCFGCHDGSITPIGAFIADPSYENHEVEPGVDGGDCDRCHDPHAETWEFVSPRAVPTASQNANLCLVCHDVGNISHSTGPTDTPIDRTWDPYATPEPDFSGTRLWNEAGTEVVPAGEAYMKCLTCHTVHGAVSEDLTSMTPNDLCLNCHNY